MAKAGGAARVAVLQLGAPAGEARAVGEERACAREADPTEATAAAGAEGGAAAGAGVSEASVEGQPRGQQGPVADGAPEGTPHWSGALRLFEVGDDVQAEQQLPHPCPHNPHLHPQS